MHNVLGYLSKTKQTIVTTWNNSHTVAHAIDDFQKLLQLTPCAIQDLCSRYALVRLFLGFPVVERDQNGRFAHDNDTLLAEHYAHCADLIQHALSLRRQEDGTYTSPLEHNRDHSGHITAEQLAQSYFETYNTPSDFIVSLGTSIYKDRDTLNAHYKTIHQFVMLISQKEPSTEITETVQQHASYDENAKIYFMLYLILNTHEMHNALLQYYKQTSPSNAKLINYIEKWLPTTSLEHTSLAPWHTNIMSFLGEFNTIYQSTRQTDLLLCALRAFLNQYFKAYPVLFLMLKDCDKDIITMTLLWIALSIDPKDITKDRIDAAMRRSSEDNPYAILYTILDIPEDKKSDVSHLLKHMLSLLKESTESTTADKILPIGRILEGIHDAFSTPISTQEKSQTLPTHTVHTIRNIIHNVHHLNTYLVILSCVIICALIIMITVQLHVAHMLSTVSLLKTLIGGLCALISSLGIGALISYYILPYFIPPIPIPIILSQPINVQKPEEASNISTSHIHDSNTAPFLATKPSHA